MTIAFTRSCIVLASTRLALGQFTAVPLLFAGVHRCCLAPRPFDLTHWCSSCRAADPLILLLTRAGQRWAGCSRLLLLSSCSDIRWRGLLRWWRRESAPQPQSVAAAVAWPPTGRCARVARGLFMPRATARLGMHAPRALEPFETRRLAAPLLITLHLAACRMEAATPPGAAAARPHRPRVEPAAAPPVMPSWRRRAVTDVALVTASDADNNHCASRQACAADTIIVAIALRQCVPPAPRHRFTATGSGPTAIPSRVKPAALFGRLDVTFRVRRGAESFKPVNYRYKSCSTGPLETPSSHQEGYLQLRGRIPAASARRRGCRLVVLLREGLSSGVALAELLRDGRAPS